MALSGVINGTTANPGITSKITWSATQSIDGNYSVITAVGTLNWTANLKTYGTGTYYMKIGDSTGSNTLYAEITQGSNTQVISHTAIVPHNTDGTKSVTLTFSGGITETTLTSISCSALVTLDTIPRATTPTLSVSTVDMGTAITISLPRASSSFTHTLQYSFFGLSGTIGTGLTTSKSWTPAVSMATQVPSATSGVCTITCKTYNGSTEIGTKTVSLTLLVPASVVPTVSISLTAVDAKLGYYVQGLSKVKVTTTAAGNQGSTIKSYSVSGGGYSGNTASFTTGVLGNVGSNVFTVIVMDSRGRTATASASLTVYAYERPKITNANAFRSNSAGAEANAGTYIAAIATATCSSVNGKNTVALTAKYRLKSASSYGSAIALVSGTKKVIASGITTASYYVVQITATDSVGQSTSLEFGISAMGAITVWGQDRWGIRKYPEGAGGWVDGEMHVSGAIYGNLTGNASGNAGSATKLQTARTINGTSFNGSANISTANWGSARTFTIGSSGKAVNGSANITWSLAEIGAAAASHRHASALLWSGSMSSGSITITNGMLYGILSIIGFVGSGSSMAEHTVATAALNTASLPIEIADDGTWMGLTVAKSGNNVTIAYRNGSGTLKYVSGY